MNTAEEAIKNAPTDLLCEAAGTLQKAHDYVEAHEFDIGEYLPCSEAEVCCFVGSVHHFSGDRTPARTRDKAAALALTALDGAAMAKGEPQSHHYEVGGTAEHYGFSHDLYGRDEKEKAIALDVYRQALRIMHAELMSREAVPA